MMNDEKKSGVGIQGLGDRGALSLLVGLFLFSFFPGDFNKYRC